MPRTSLSRIASSTSRHFSSCRCHLQNPPDQSDKPKTASAHLYSLAEQEEVIENAILKAQNAPKSDKPWEGEISVRDSVLRALVDSQPAAMRVPGWKNSIQQPTSRPLPEEEVVASTSKLPDQSSTPDRAPYPWEAVYRAPSHHLGLPSVRYGKTVPSSARKPSKIERLVDAREAILEYGELDHESRAEKYSHDRGRRPMPGSIAAWQSLVEEKIQEAIQNGLFKKVKGRGKPMVRHQDEDNPYLDTTEFLMNRIVKQQGAAPAWIELQGQLDSSIESFRNTLKDSWIRRAVRMITLSGLEHLTPAYIRQSSSTYRDPEWEARELSFHELSLKEINNQLRLYNAIAPYITRRAPYSLEKELAECYADSAGMIRTALTKRVEDHKNGVRPEDAKRAKRKNRYGLMEQESSVQGNGLWPAIKRLFVE